MDWRACSCANIPSWPPSNTPMSATAAVLQSLNVVLMAIVMAAWNKKPIGRGQVLAVLLAIAGTYLIASKGDFHRMDFSAAGLLFGLLAAAGVVSYTLLSRPIIASWGNLTITGWGMLIGGLVLFLFTKAWNVPAALDLTAWIVIAAIVLIGTAVGKRAVHRTGEIDADRVSGAGVLHGVFRGGAENADLLGGVDRLRPDPLHGVPFRFGKRGRLTDASQMASPQTMPLLLLFNFLVPAVNPYSVKTIGVQRL